MSSRTDERLLRITTTEISREDALEIAATDRVLQYRETVWGVDDGVKVTDKGILLLDAKDFVNRIALMPPGLLKVGIAAGTFANGNLRVTIRHKEQKTMQQTAAVPPNGLPPISWPEKSQEKNLASLSGEALAAILTRAMWAAEPSEAETAANAVWVLVERGRVYVAAGTQRSIGVVETADGARAHVLHDEAEPAVLALSLKSARQLAAFGRSAGPSPVVLSAAPAMIVAREEGGGRALGCALLAIPFRDLRGILEIVVRGQATQEIVVDKAAFLLGLSRARAGIHAQSDNPGVYLAAHGTALHVVGEGAGGAYDAVPTATPITRPMTGQYLPIELQEAATAAAGSELSLLFCDAPGTPLLLTDDEAGFRLSAVIIGMVKYKSQTLERLFAKAKEDAAPEKESTP